MEAHNTNPKNLQLVSADSWTHGKEGIGHFSPVMIAGRALSCSAPAPTNTESTRRDGLRSRSEIVRDDEHPVGLAMPLVRQFRLFRSCGRVTAL